MKNIRTMLQKVQKKLKIDGHILPTIISEIRLKQGDNLSPIEFELFLMMWVIYSIQMNI